MPRRRRKKKIKKFIQLKNKDLKEFREHIHIHHNKYICPICQCYTELEDTTLDHQHKLNKSQAIGDNGAGLCRDVICRQCNTLEGKIWNNFTRLGFHKKDLGSDNPIKSRANILRRMADHYEFGYLKSNEGEYYIHPTEEPPLPKMGKLIFNRINKAYKIKYPNRKPLEIPKSAIIKKGAKKGQIGMWKITASWEALIEEFDIEV